MTFPLSIYALDREVFSGNAISVTAPGAIGELQVLADHVPFVTSLKEGTLNIEKEDKSTQEIPIAGGTLEVKDKEVILLVRF